LFSKTFQKKGLRLFGLIFLAFCTSFNCLKAQSADPQVNIQLLAPDQGLTDRAVRCIVQDSMGFLWIGNGAALWRYDGYSFYNYTYLLTSSSNTIKLIEDIKLAPDKQIWVAHSNGLTIINPITLQSASHDISSLLARKLISRQVVKIYFDVDGAAWVSLLGNTLVKLDNRAKPILLYSAPKRESDELFAKRAISKILQDHTGKLYLFSVDNYLDVINKNGKRLHGIDLRDKTLPKGFFAANINFSHQQNLQVYYRKVNQKTSLVCEYSFAKETFIADPENRYARYPGDTYVDYKGLIWYKSENEIGFLNSKTGKLTRPTEQIQEKAGVETYFFNACISSDNTFWLCSSAGLFKITAFEPLFKTYLSKQLRKATDVGTSMRGITEDSTGNLWLCSYGFKKDNNTYLVHKLDPQTGSILHKQIRVLKDTTRTAYILYKIVFLNNEMYAITDGISLLRLKPDGSALNGKGFYNVSVNELTSIYILNDAYCGWVPSAA